MTKKWETRMTVWARVKVLRLQPPGNRPKRVCPNFGHSLQIRISYFSTGTRYIPPHLRRAQRENQEASEDTIKLTRHLKGLLNRMSEQNMSGILDKIEEIYRNHRRNGKLGKFPAIWKSNSWCATDVTSNLTRLIIDGIASHSSLLDSYVVMYAAFVASLHKIIGIEFGVWSSSSWPSIVLIFSTSRSLYSKCGLIIWEILRWFAHEQPRNCARSRSRSEWKRMLKSDSPTFGAL